MENDISTFDKLGSWQLAKLDFPSCFEVGYCAFYKSTFTEIAVYRQDLFTWYQNSTDVLAGGMEGYLIIFTMPCILPHAWTPPQLVVGGRFTYPSFPSMV